MVEYQPEWRYGHHYQFDDLRQQRGIQGGGIFNIDGVLQLFNSTVSGNNAAIGGGVATFGDAATRTDVSSSIIAGNTATTEGNDVSAHEAGGSNSFMSLGENLIGDGESTAPPSSPMASQRHCRHNRCPD